MWSFAYEVCGNEWLPNLSLPHLHLTRGGRKPMHVVVCLSERIFPWWCWTSHGCGFCCFGQKWPTPRWLQLCRFFHRAPRELDSTHFSAPSHLSTHVPECGIALRSGLWGFGPAAAPSIFWVGDARHNLSCSQTAEVIIFLQPVLEAESQWVWFRLWFLTQGNFERCEVKKAPQLSLPPQKKKALSTELL